MLVFLWAITNEIVRCSSLSLLAVLAPGMKKLGWRPKPMLPIGEHLMLAQEFVIRRISPTDGTGWLLHKRSL